MYCGLCGIEVGAGALCGNCLRIKLEESEMSNVGPKFPGRFTGEGIVRNPPQFTQELLLDLLIEMKRQLNKTYALEDNKDFYEMQEVIWLSMAAIKSLMMTKA